MISLAQEQLLSHGDATASPVKVATHLHVPTPGDHFSPATGSAAMTIIHELSRQHTAHGGEALVLVGRNTRHDYASARCVEIEAPPLPTRQQKLVDVALGRAGFERRFEPRTFQPSADAIERSFDGVIFLHNAAGAVPLFRRRAPRATICLYCHNQLFGTYGQREARRIVDSADRLICVSQFVADAHARRAGMDAGPRGKFRVVLNGVDTERFRPSRTIPSEKRPVILFVGRVTADKGPDLLLRAAAKIVDNSPPFTVRIVGSRGFSATEPLSAYEQELRGLAEPLGEAVQFQPFVDRDAVVQEYANASIFCIPSNWDEPCGMTISEAMACGLPTIASRRGGIPEVGADAALYFDSSDVSMLADRLANLLADPKSATQWGAKARSRAEEISWQRQYTTLATVLN
jgi:glycosyltransferase involved in cell wall biosynthesis